MPSRPVSERSAQPKISSSTTNARSPCLFRPDPGVKSPREGYPHVSSSGNRKIGATVIVLGIILLVIGYFTGIGILYTIGGILVVVGIVLWILGAVGRPVAGRKVWF